MHEPASLGVFTINGHGYPDGLPAARIDVKKLIQKDAKSVVCNMCNSGKQFAADVALESGLPSCGFNCSIREAVGRRDTVVYLGYTPETASGWRECRRGDYGSRWAETSTRLAEPAKVFKLAEKVVPEAEAKALVGGAGSAGPLARAARAPTPPPVVRSPSAPAPRMTPGTALGSAVESHALLAPAWEEFLSTWSRWHVRIRQRQTRSSRKSWRLVAVM